MRRINTPNRAIDLFGAGKHGWKNGVPGTADRPTEGQAEWFNAVQEELSNLVEELGEDLDPEDNGQLATLLAGGGRFDPEVAYVPRALAWALKQGAINIAWFDGADPTGATDMTSIMQAAELLGHAIYVPTGRWAMNWTATRRLALRGDGNTASIIVPFNTATAAITYSFAAMSNPAPLAYWTYGSEVRDIGFVGSAKTGIGFTFGKTSPGAYADNDEYVNNVRFPGCRFSDLEKGVQCPFGNIGNNFRDAGFDYCKYGIYAINAKVASADVMHAGNKYIDGGEFHRCDCAIYVHNTAPGFGGVTLRGTILQYNYIGLYIYSNAGALIAPVLLENLWLESNGTVQGGTVTVDAWAGAVRSDLVLAARSIIVDGDNVRVNARDCGVLGDVWLRGTNIEFETDGCRIEASAGYNAGPWTVDSPDTSYVAHHNPLSDGGWRNGAGSYVPIVTGRMRDEGQIATPGGRSAGRVFLTAPRSSKVTNYGPSRVFSATLVAAATTGGGSFGLVGTQVNDGRLYSQCTEFTRAAFTGAQNTRLTVPDSSIVTSAGWHVMTVDLKVVSGAGVMAYVWDRSTAQLAAGASCNSVGKWYTIAAMGYSEGGQTLFLDFAGMDGNVTWRVSAYQLHRFDTRQEAQLFLASGVFAES